MIPSKLNKNAKEFVPAPKQTGANSRAATNKNSKQKKPKTAQKNRQNDSSCGEEESYGKTTSDSAVGRLARSVGGIFGNSVGEIAGSIGNIFSSVTGLGDYEVKENTVKDELITGAQVPAMHSTKDSFILRHREYIADVTSSTAFANKSFAVNPGLSSSFPWLASIAANFTQYRFLGLIYEYRTTSSTIASTNPAMGAVCLSSEYNVYALPFTNKQEVDNNMWTTSSRPCDTFVHPIECAPLMNPLQVYFIRTGSVPTGQDARLYDLCNIQLITSGAQTAAVGTIGELWCTYEVELLKPQLQGGLGATVEGCEINIANYTNVTVPLVTGTVSKIYDTLGVTLVVGQPSMTIAAGNTGVYLWEYVGCSASNHGVMNTLVGGTSHNINILNCNPTVAGGDLTTFQSSYGTNVYGTTSFMFSLIDPTQPGTLTLGTFTPSSSTNFSTITITQVNEVYATRSIGVAYV